MKISSSMLILLSLFCSVVFAAPGDIIVEISKSDRSNTIKKFEFSQYSVKQEIFEYECAEESYAVLFTFFGNNDKSIKNLSIHKFYSSKSHLKIQNYAETHSYLEIKNGGPLTLTYSCGHNSNAATFKISVQKEYIYIVDEQGNPIPETKSPIDIDRDPNF